MEITERIALHKDKYFFLQKTCEDVYKIALRKKAIYCLIFLNVILFNYHNADARNRVEKPAAPITNEAFLKIKSYLPNTIELNKKMSAKVFQRILLEPIEVYLC